LYLLSDSEPLEENIDLPINDDGEFDDFFDYCFAKMEMELDGRGELIGEEEADGLYGVSNTVPKAAYDSVLMCLKESVDQWDVESETENVLTEDILEADSVREWFDDDHENTWAQTDILDIIKIRMKEVKKFRTPRAFKAFSDFTAIMQYHKLRERYRSNARCTQPCLRASLAIATRSGKGVTNGAYFARRIRKIERFLQTHGCLPPTTKDGLHGYLTLLDNENVKLGVRKYLASQSLGIITTKAFCREVNEVIVPSFGFSGKDATISERTARNWLHKLGYSCMEVRKGLYHDGHERPDVVKARTKFLQEMAKYERSVSMITVS
jgi:hypothetical protein